MRIIITLTALLLLSVSVSFAAEAPFGVWEWTHTETEAGLFINTLENGNSLQRQFNDDMTFSEFRDEAPVLAGVFWVQDLVYEGTPFQILNLDFGGISPARSPYFVNNDGMLLMYWGVDYQSGEPSYPIEYFATRSPISTEPSSWDSFKALFR